MSILFYVIFAFLASISPHFVEPSFSYDGISGYCNKSRLYPRNYPRVPIECCNNDEGRCHKYIGPGKTKWGLTNPDLTWPRRHCKCDVKLFECVTKDLDVNMKQWARNHGFHKETCFHKRFNQIARGNGEPRYTFVSLLSVIPN